MCWLYLQLNNNIFQTQGRLGEASAFPLVQRIPMESDMTWSNYKMDWSNYAPHASPSVRCFLPVHKFPIDSNMFWSKYVVGLE